MLWWTRKMQISFWNSDLISFRYIPQSGITRSYSDLIFDFWGTYILFSIMMALIYIPTKNSREFPFLSTLTKYLLSLLFNNNPSNRCEVKPHYGFYFAFLWWELYVNYISIKWGKKQITRKVGKSTIVIKAFNMLLSRHIKSIKINHEKYRQLKQHFNMFVQD